MTGHTHSPPAYRFGLFEAFPESCELFKQGRRIRLQEQPFRILIALLERPGEIVARETIRQRLWPENTFVEFDQSLGTAITKLRQGLGDDADNPRFIETVPRRGYRFLAPVTRVLPQVVTTASTNSEVQPSTKLTPASVGIRGVSRNRAWIALVTVSLFVGAAVFAYRLREAHPLLSSSDAVVLAGFRNTTGDIFFDGTLYRVVRVKLEESPFLNVVPEKLTRAAIEKSEGKVPNEISLEDARAACSDLSAKAVIYGEISRAGQELQVRLLASPCLQGRPWVMEEVTGATPEQIVSQVSLATDRLRWRLGEPQASIDRFKTPIAQATTYSLAALKAFSVGEEKRSRGLDFETLSDYKLATDLDQNFALAYARMGTINSNIQEFARGALNYQKAFELREHTTERERLYITSHYYSTVFGDLEKTAEVYSLWRQMYPRDLIPPNNLADTYTILGQPEKAFEMGVEALRLGPSNGFPYIVYCQAAQRLGKYGEAKTAARDAIAKKLDGLNLHMVLFRIAFAEKDDAAMQHELDWAHGNPREGESLDLVGWANTARGRPHEARNNFHRAEEVALRNDLKEFAADVAEDEAQFEADLGFPAQARQETKWALKIAPDELNVKAFAALILAEVGDSDRFRTLAAEVQRKAPQNTIYIKMVLPTARAQEDLHVNDPQGALENLKAVAPYDLSRPMEMSPIYYRAEALLAVHRNDDAVAEFQRLLDHSPVCPISPYIALAHLGIARARRNAGSLAAAREEYKTFLDLWKDADPDIPIFRQARAEYAQLNNGKTS